MRSTITFPSRLCQTVSPASYRGRSPKEVFRPLSPELTHLSIVLLPYTVPVLPISFARNILAFPHDFLFVQNLFQFGHSVTYNLTGPRIVLKKFFLTVLLWYLQPLHITFFALCLLPPTSHLFFDGTPFLRLTNTYILFITTPSKVTPHPHYR